MEGVRCTFVPFPLFCLPMIEASEAGVLWTRRGHQLALHPHFPGNQPGKGRFRTTLYPVTENAGEKFRETGHGHVRRVSTQAPQVVTTTLSCDLRFSISHVHPEPSHHRLRRINGNRVVHRPLQVGSEGPFRSTLRGPTGPGPEK